MTTDVIKRSFRIDSGVSAGGIASLHLAIEVQATPAALNAARPVALVCLPGGGMNRRYYDLRPPGESGGDDRYSFAAQMMRRGFIAVLVDHPGIGESDKPEDSYALTPGILTQAGNSAVARLLDGLRAGTLLNGTDALPALRSIIVGHSMGAMLAVLQQAASGQHAAVAVLGFGTRGLPDYLPAPVRELAADTEALRQQLVPLARAMFVEDYPEVRRSDSRSVDLYGSGKAEAAGIAGLKAASDCMLPVPAYLSMVPGNIAPETNALTAPVFIGVGERDMVGAPHEIPASFRASGDVTLLVLPQTGHSHFLFPSRNRLFDRLANWAQSILSQST